MNTTQNYGGMPGYGYANVTMPPRKTNQVLTDEQMQYLSESSGKFDLAVTLEQKYKAICTHRDKNGELRLVELPDGRCHCNICHEEFTPYAPTPDELDTLVDKMIDVLQTIKIMWIDAPRQVLIEYFLIIELLKKLKTIFRRAVSNFNAYETQVNNANNGMMNPGFNGFNGYYNVMGGINPFTVYGFSYNPNFGYQPQPQQPMAPVDQGYAAQQPGYGVYPQYNQPYATNPFGYNAAPGAPAAPAPGAMPAAPAVQAPATTTVPTQPSAPTGTPAAVAPAAPQSDVQQTQVFSV